MAEILASIDDVNANLPSEENVVIEATDLNTSLIQISVARIVRGNLSRVIAVETLSSWVNPDVTPEIIREIASKLIASQLYFSESAKSSLNIDPDSFAQKLYDEAMLLINGIVAGTIAVEGEGGVITDDTASMGELDFWPIDDTGRAFSMGMEL
jgi:hypothetical protein